MIGDKPLQILNNAYKRALSEFKRNNGEAFLKKLPANARNWIMKIGERPEKHKAIVAVLVTLLTKKIENPKQDIRYHRAEMKGGFAARSYDTRHVTPFIKEKFGTKFAMKESGWLTRSFEKPEPYLLNYTGKIRPEKLKNAFLRIIDDVQRKGSTEVAEKYLISLFILLLRKKKELENLATKKVRITVDKKVPLKLILQCLNEHFKSPTPSRLPVIAIYSAYKVLIEEVTRYKGKKLKPLRTHVSPDQYAGLGDVEVIDEEGNYFEVVEVKYNKPIDLGSVIDIYGKLEREIVNRYYLLTTADPYIIKTEQENINIWVKKIREERGCELIINGVIPTIQYYLRLMEDATKYIKAYTNTLQEEFQKRAEITEDHVKRWLEIISKLDN